MKPKTIYIYRHGESIGNVDWTNYCKMEDEDIPLSNKGKGQAATAALDLLDRVPASSVAVYSSHFLRAVQTANYVKDVFKDRVIFTRIDEDMRELLWAPRCGIPDAAKQSTEREIMKSFWNNNPGGESAKQVWDRMGGVIERLENDFKKDDYPNTAILISHGIAMRCFLMKLLGWSVTMYDHLVNPPNCGLVTLILDHDQYRLSSSNFGMYKV